MSRKLAFVFPSMAVGKRAFDFFRLWDMPRGLTGSDTMTFMFAQELANRGHDVTLLIGADGNPKGQASFGRVRIGRIEEGAASEAMQGYDVVCATFDVNILRHAPASSKRVVLMQLHDFDYGMPGFDAWVDAYVSPSRAHVAWMMGRSPVTTPEKWHVVPNGCSVDAYPVLDRIPGRCVYASSPDRGLHRLLEAWPAIKAAVPHATLRIYYFALKQYIDEWAGRAEGSVSHPYDKEHCRRSHAIARMLRELDGQGVEAIGATSKNELARELARAELMLYPVDTIAFSESFSCSILEGCASGAFPVVIGADAIGDIYKDACPMVPAPAKENLAEWTMMAVMMLKHADVAEGWRARAKAFAIRHDWRKMAEKLEAVLCA